MEKLDEGLKTLLDLGKRRGFLTFDQVNESLPDESSANPDKIQGLLDTIDELGIELVSEEEAESRLLANGDLDDESDELVDEAAEEEVDKVLGEIFREKTTTAKLPSTPLTPAPQKDAVEEEEEEEENAEEMMDQMRNRLEALRS